MTENNEKNRSTDEKEVEKPVEARLEADGRVTIDSERKTEIYNKGYYGEFSDGKLFLKPLEALLLLERKRIKILDSNKKEVDFRELVFTYLKNDPVIWVKYLVYRDLRSRGYTVGIGYEGTTDFRVYERGAVPKKDASKYLVYVIEEGVPLALNQLEKIISVGASSRKKTAIAVVDRQ
ncbi:MAG: tRNA-intron lyase, partial [Candidatus Odinarchaeia archaeon]